MRESIETGAPARRRAFVVAALAGIVALTGLAAVPGAEAKKKEKGVQVKVMTRNIFLGADLGPALSATSFNQFTAANGAILREVDKTNFPLRAVGLAQEIMQKKPDLVGIQEGAWWRTNPTAGPPVQGESTAYTALTTKYDFLELLLAELNKNTNKKYKGYEVAIVGDEFDFEAPTDYDNDQSTGALFGGEIQGRLTMRDAILVRKGGAVKVKNPLSGHYANVYTPNISGIDVPVTRGWVSVDATATAGEGKEKVKRKFHFVNSHFEAFDDETQHPSIRSQQASELLAGPAANPKSIILGDFNSNNPPVQPGDEQAYDTLVAGGFEERSMTEPITCCINDLFAPTNTFDHKVDHVMTNMGKKVKLVNSSATGTSPVNGIYDSDHAGVFSTLKLK